jgi:catechol 2,3-dioxygenase-like lactoylglutathione lyase family enzyme
MSTRLFRIILPVTDIDAAATWYGAVLEMPGQRVSPGRHYFDLGGTILACYSGDSDSERPNAPNPQHIYISVDDLDAALARVQAAGPSSFDTRGEEPGIAVRPWRERSFYFTDPFGNQICIVEAGTEFTGR